MLAFSPHFYQCVTHDFFLQPCSFIDDSGGRIGSRGSSKEKLSDKTCGRCYNNSYKTIPNELEAFTKDEVRIKVNYETFIGRFEMAPIEELVLGYETMWHNMVKTMVSPEWSCWFEDKEAEEMTIVVGRKVDKRMI